MKPLLVVLLGLTIGASAAIGVDLLLGTAHELYWCEEASREWRMENRRLNEMLEECQEEKEHESTHA
jgi:uncharacterized protein (DUF1786 family)